MCQNRLCQHPDHLNNRRHDLGKILRDALHN